MGTFKWPVRVSSMYGQQMKDIDAIVGTGIMFTTLPGSLLRELGIESRGRRRVPLADGRHVNLDYGQAWVTIGDESEITLVVFGEDDAPALLGTYTLTGLALAVDPTEQRLVPTPLILY